MNGNIAMLFAADDITSAENTMLRAYMNTTANIAGCQAIRTRIGSCCFGFRVVQGECIFVTVSPNRRHSSMILKFARVRANDVGLGGKDPVTLARKLFAGSTSPKIFSNHSLHTDETGEQTRVEIPLPGLHVRQACNAQDPLASVYHYLFSCMS